MATLYVEIKICLAQSREGAKEQKTIRHRDHRGHQEEILMI
jgi:hypothetical protein